MSFYVGQRVVCVGGRGFGGFSRSDWDEWARYWGVTFAKKGEIYTVRNTRSAPDGTQRIRVAEIVNPAVEFKDAPKQEPWFIGWHFRPVVDRPTDISVLTALLTPAKQTEDA